MKTATGRGHENWEISEEARAALIAYNWPGNVRELRNTVRRACIMATEAQITAELLPFAPVRVLPPRESVPAAPSQLPLWVIERDHIENVLEQVEGNKSRAAKILEIDRKTLYTKLERYGLDAVAQDGKATP